MKDAIGTIRRDIQILQDDRKAHCSSRDIRERECGSNVAAAAGIAFRDDPAVLERVGLHEQRRNQSATAAAASSAAVIKFFRISTGEISWIV